MVIVTDHFFSFLEVWLWGPGAYFVWLGIYIAFIYWWRKSLVLFLYIQIILLPQKNDVGLSSQTLIMFQKMEENQHENSEILFSFPLSRNFSGFWMHYLQWMSLRGDLTLKFCSSYSNWCDEGGVNTAKCLAYTGLAVFCPNVIFLCFKLE